MPKFSDLPESLAPDSNDYVCAVVDTVSSRVPFSAILSAFGIVQGTRQVIAGTGLTGGGALSGDITLNVVANADGSIIANANDVQVGVLATDAQHGVRGGGTQHAAVVAGGASGFMTGADKTKLDAFSSATAYLRADGTVAQTANNSIAKVDFTSAGGALTGSHMFVKIDTTGGDCALTLPATADFTGNRVFILQKISADANVITLLAPTALIEINGDAGFNVTPYEVPGSSISGVNTWMVTRLDDGNWTVSPGSAESVITESGGANLAVGSIPDGSFFRRVGTDVVGTVMVPSDAAADDLFYWNGTAMVRVVTAGVSDGDVLTFNTGAEPTWEAPTGGGGGLPSVQYIRGFATSKGYQHPDDVFSGQTRGTLAAFCMIEENAFSSAGRQIVGTLNNGGGAATAGIGIIVSGNIVTARYFDNGSVSRSATGFQPPIASKWVLICLRYDANGADLGLSLWFNGDQVGELFQSGAGGTPAAGADLFVGGRDGGAADAATVERVQGAGWVNRAVTAGQMAEWYRACVAAGQLVDIPSGGGLSGGWRVSGGVEPGATWTAFAGATVLTRVGTALTYGEDDYVIYK